MGYKCQIHPNTIKYTHTHRCTSYTSLIIPMPQKLFDVLSGLLWMPVEVGVSPRTSRPRMLKASRRLSHAWTERKRRQRVKMLRRVSLKSLLGKDEDISWTSWIIIHEYIRAVEPLRHLLEFTIKSEKPGYILSPSTDLGLRLSFATQVFLSS